VPAAEPEEAIAFRGGAFGRVGRAMGRTTKRVLRSISPAVPNAERKASPRSRHEPSLPRTSRTATRPVRVLLTTASPCRLPRRKALRRISGSVRESVFSSRRGCARPPSGTPRGPAENLGSANGQREQARLAGEVLVRECREVGHAGDAGRTLATAPHLRGGRRGAAAGGWK
jgi:hypothetical protein